MIRLVPLLLILAVSPARAAENASGLEDPARQERFRELTWVLRCPKCQNQNIADSNAPVAADLRNEIVRMLREDRSNEEIIEFMVARYGEFVLYQPRVAGANLLLWLVPAAALLTGFAAIVVRARRRRQPTALDPQEAQKLARLLDDGDREP